MLGRQQVAVIDAVFAGNGRLRRIDEFVFSISDFRDEVGLNVKAPIGNDRIKRGNFKRRQGMATECQREIAGQSTSAQIKLVEIANGLINAKLAE